MLNELLKQKFTSGNDVPVTSVRVTRAEYEQALQAEKTTVLRGSVELAKEELAKITLPEADLKYSQSYLEECLADIESYLPLPEQVPNKLLDDAVELLKHFTDFPEEDFAGEENFPYTMSVWMNKLREAREVIAAYDLNKGGAT